MYKYLLLGVALLLLTQQSQAVAPPKILMLIDDTSITASHPDKNWWAKSQRGISTAQTDFTIDVIIYKADSLYKVTADSFSLKDIGVVVIAAAGVDKLSGFIQKVNQLRIPIISFQTGTSQQATKINAMMHIATTYYTLGTKAGRRANLLGKLTFSCFYTIKSSVNSEICKGFAFGINGLFLNEREVLLPNNKQTAHKILLNEIKVNNSNLLVTIGHESAKTVMSILEKEQLQNSIFHVTLAMDSQVPQWVSEGKIDFGFLFLPWLESYLALAAAHATITRKLYDPIDIVVSIRTNPRIQQRLAAYGLVIYYDNGTIRSSPGFIYKNNVRHITQLWGDVW